MPRIALLLTILAAVACSPDGRPRPEPTSTPTSSRASGLREPFAYVTPTPPPEPTAVDGLYRREVGEDLAGPSGACRRCPPYRMEVSTQTLHLDRGVFLIENEVVAERSIDWRSIGHYTIEGRALRLFNDPNCPGVDGRYEWILEDGLLELRVVADPCAFGGLRWRYLTAAPWLAG